MGIESYEYGFVFVRRKALATVLDPFMRHTLETALNGRKVEALVEVVNRQAAKLVVGKIVFVGGNRFTNLATEHGGVVPGEIKFRVRCESGELPQRLIAVLIIKQEDELLFAFDQRKYVDFFIHLRSSDSNERPCQHTSRLPGLPGLSIGSVAIAR